MPALSRTSQPARFTVAHVLYNNWIARPVVAAHLAVTEIRTLPKLAEHGEALKSHVTLR